MYSTLVSLGALTSKVSAYKYRSWELETKASIDYFDSIGIIGNACIKGLTILRILPNNNSNLFDWLSDKFRFSFDSILENRNLRVLYRKEEVSLFMALQVIVDFIFEYTNIYFFLGKTLDVVDTLVIKDFSGFFINSFYINDSFNNLTQVSVDQRILNYINFEEAVNFRNLIIWGVDLRLEFPVLENFYFNKLKFEDIYVIGVTEAYGFNLGTNFLKHFSGFVNGTHVLVKNILKKSSLFFSGVGLFGRYLDVALLNFVYIFFANLQKIYRRNLTKHYFLSSYMSDINTFELGLITKKIGGVALQNSNQASLLFLVENSDIVCSRKFDFSICFSAYNKVENHQRFDLNFPLVSIIEKNVMTYNIQGILNSCEKLVKNTLAFNLSSYITMFKAISKYMLSIGFISQLYKKANHNISLINIFLVVFEKRLHLLHNLYIHSFLLCSIRKLPLFTVFVNVALQNATSNYYYTHINLLYSPTILLADARFNERTFLVK